MTSRASFVRGRDRNPAAFPRCIWFCGIVLCALLPVAPAGAEFDPFEVPKEQVLRRVQTVALLPVRLPARTESAEAIAQDLERRIAEKLSPKLEVIPSREYEAIWNRLSRQVDGVYDPATGEADEEKRELVWEHTANELARRFGADAVMAVYVTVDEVPWAFGKSLGDELTWNGEWIGSPNFGGALPQKVTGTYLNTLLSDLSGAKLYGIRYPMEWTHIYVARQHQAREELYANADAKQDAVEEILAPLVGAAPAGPPPQSKHGRPWKKDPE